MKSRGNRGILIALWIAVTLFPLGHAGTASAICTVSTAPADFGSYDVLLPVAQDIVTSITVDCNEAPPVIPTISIGPSPNSGGFDPRQMKLSGGSEFINYNFYVDPGRTQIWGDGSGSTFTISNKVTKNKSWIASIYGRIPPGQDVSVGTYSENLTVVIVW